MTQPEYRFPNAARTIAKLLEAFTSAQRAGTRTPANLTGLLPFIRVVRHGGPSDALNDYARIHIDVLAATAGEAEALAERIREHLTTARLRLGTAVIDRVAVDSAPEELAPWATGVYRYEARYTVVSRRYRTPS